jgi:hypothetical protein
MEMTLWGHTTTHKPQPLQSSLSIMIFPAISTSVLSQMYDCSEAEGVCKAKLPGKRNRPTTIFSRNVFIARDLRAFSAAA